MKVSINKFLVTVLTATAFFGTGCDIFDLDATRVSAGYFYHVPEISTSSGSIPEFMSAMVFFGERDPGADVFQTPPRGITGAEVILSIFSDGASVLDVELSDNGGGRYITSSDINGNLVYSINASYRVEISEMEDVFEVDTEQAPAPESIDGVPGFHPSGESMIVGRSGMRIAFVDIYRFMGGSAEITFSNRPESTGDILDVIADPFIYQATSFEIPETAFPAPGEYALVLTSTVRGVPDFELYSGSGFLLGTGSYELFTVE